MGNDVRAFATGLIFCTIFLATGCQESSTSNSDSSAKSTVAGTVQLEIVFNSDRKDINVAVPCSADSTVFKIMERAQNMGDLGFKSTGLKDDSMFVTSISGVENLAGAGDNWVYWVNGKLGDKSSGVFSVKPGDQIQWAFGKYEPQED